jgi:hypothetical protein
MYVQKLAVLGRVCMVSNSCYKYVSFRYYSYQYPKVPIYVSECSASNDGGGVGNKRPDGGGVRFGLISMLAIISITKANRVTAVGSIKR